MKTNYKECIIFSVYQDNPVFDVNERNHDRVIESLEWNGVEHKELITSCKGVIEKAILVSINQKHYVDVICKLYMRETYLIIDKNLIAWTIETGYNEQYFIGKFIKCSKEQAQKRDRWTFNPQTRKYYIIEG